MDTYQWWQRGIIYQIYPRSYQDSNDDGIGDLGGIRRRLDYLEKLKIDAIWLSPIYPSPMHDFGYDVADHKNIHPLFGTLDDFDQLVTETHKRGLKLILDFVPNHTSHEHAWFIESRSDRTNPKRDWYIWRDPAEGGGPPNNWLSAFGGPAWTYDESSGQYYLHQFLKEQPELNYRNPAVLEAMLDVMRFWLDRGVDGFRVDVIFLLLKDPQFRDEPPNPDWGGVNPFYSLKHMYTRHVPGVYDIIRKMKEVLEEYDERMLIGEGTVPDHLVQQYYETVGVGGQMPFNFGLIRAKWKAHVVRQIVDSYDARLPEGAWPNWVLGNHDQPRIASRIGEAQARVANMLLLTLRGTPTTYYGEEIGMLNVAIPLDRIQDPPAINQPEIAEAVGRDPERTPMQWEGVENAGFTSPQTLPWLPLGADFMLRNVQVQEVDPNSMLNLYRKLTTLRRKERALHVGAYRSIEVGTDDVFVYLRTAEAADSFLIALNFDDQELFVNIGDYGVKGKIEVSTWMDREGDVNLAKLSLRPAEGLLIRL